MRRPKCANIAALAIVLCVALVGVRCGGGSRRHGEVAVITKDFLETYFKAHPVFATWAGDHRYDDRIDDVSAAAVASELEELRGYRARLARLDPSKLQIRDRVDAEMLENQIERRIMEIEELRAYERDPLVYTQLLGGSINCLIARDFAPLEERLEAAVGRLGEFPRVVEQAMENLSTPSKVHTDTAILQNRGTMKLIADDLMREAARVPARTAQVERAIGPALEALRRFQDYLERDLAFRSTGDFRLGDRLYRKWLARTLQSDMTPEEIVSKASVEVDNVRERMFELAAPLHAEMVSRAPLAIPRGEGRKEVIRRVLDDISKNHPKASALLDSCRAAFAEASAFVREKNIVAIPPEPLEIIWTPEFMRGVSMMGLDFPGPLEKGMKSFFVVSPAPDYLSTPQVEAYLREYNSEMIRIVTIHEAMPGHFVQFAYGNRNPSIVRALFPNEAFAEGWAVYCMKMMPEEGFRAGDARLKLQVEKYHLRAAINAIIDAGIHGGNMTEYDAMKLMIEGGFQEESEAVLRWNRAILMPAYLSTYFVGYREIRSLRDEAEERWGGSFRLDEFHERLLTQGAIPFPYAREILFEQ